MLRTVYNENYFMNIYPLVSFRTRRVYIYILWPQNNDLFYLMLCHVAQLASVLVTSRLFILQFVLSILLGSHFAS